MDSHGDYSPLERQRLLDAASGSSVGSGGSGGGRPSSVSEFASRTGTPTTMTTLAQYHSRYGLPSAVSGSNFALMSSLLAGQHNAAEARKTLMPDIQHYWNAQADSFPRYLMAGSIYPSYPPLLSAGAAELLGTGVAGGTATGAGPSQPHHLAHYQRLLEMQKEAYLASMSAAASHHTAIYGIGSSALPPFLDQTAVSCHGPTPLSLVKQEPKESPGAEKTNKQSEKRSASYKFDTDNSRGSREASSLSFSTLPGSLISAQLREPKLSPSSSLEVPARLDKKSSNSSSLRGSNGDLHRGKKPPVNSPAGSNPTSKPRIETRPNRPAQPASSGHSTKRTNSNSALSSNCKQSGAKSSGHAFNRLQQSMSGGKPIATSSSLMSETPIVSVPTHAASPIPLATVQLDGVVLSALATPSSAAASSFSTKAIFHNQHSEKPNRTTFGDKDLRSGRPVGEAKVSSGLSVAVIDTTLNCDHDRPASRMVYGTGGEVVTKSSTSFSNGSKPSDPTEDSKLLSDDSCDIIVDSTEKDESTTPVDSLTKSETDTSVEETISRIASAADSDVDSDQEELMPQTPADAKATNTLFVGVARTDAASVVTPSGAASLTRAVYAKTQPVLSVAVSGNIPVGIAVAQIRPHHVQQSSESQGPENLTRDSRHIHASLNTKTITTAATAPAAPAAPLPPNLVVTGPTVKQSPWLQQMPFPIHQALNSSGAAFDPSFPITAPSGYKLAHDSLTGRLFLIPSGDFVEQGGVWPSPAFVPPSEAGNSHYQAPSNPPTVTLNGAERREGKPTEDVTAKSSSSASTADKIIPTPDSISKDVPQLTKDDGKRHPLFSAPSSLTTTPAAVPAIMVNPVTNITPTAPSVSVKVERPTVTSRGCSPVMFEDISSPLSILSTLSCLTSEKPKTCSIGVQTCDSLMKSVCKRKLSSQKFLSHDQAVQTLSPDFTAFNPLSVQCPDIDCVDPLTHCLEEKSSLDRTSYNPFTDPQILQAADGLELLSTLAEKRPKCSSIDDPKRIFPSPSDSFKSDSASLVAIEDTLSPGEMELKSGQCTPRREIRRDLSPKWSLPKKESQVASSLGDFKTPTEMEISEDSEMRVKLAEVQRQYKEKQKELAKLQIKKSEERKQSKRGPGRPPKNKTPGKKSDDESSSSSSRTKEHPHPQKKKRPAEELVDRVFRKLPPIIKPSKVSRSIHYVKSKTGPFFRRKSASSSVKRNKDLFGFDESNWPSFSEGKHQEKVKDKCSSPDKSKSRHRSNSSHSEDSKHSQDAGNIFSNMESFGGGFVDKTDYAERRRRPSKGQGQKLTPATPDMIVIKTELGSPTPQQECGLGLLAKFALNGSSLTSTSFSTTSDSGSLVVTPTVCSFSSSSTFSGTYNSGNTTSNTCNYSNTTNNTCNYSNTTNNTCNYSSSIDFGSVGNFLSSASCVMSFSNPSLATSSCSSATPSATPTSTFALLSSSSSTATSLTGGPTSSLSFSSQEIHQTVMEEFTASVNTCTSSSSGNTNISSAVNTNISSAVNVVSNCGTSSANITVNSSTNNSDGLTKSFMTNFEDTSPSKRNFEEDSDTDASDTCPNKKRKPGRPRKINADNSSCGTETIWAKKSTSIGIVQSPDSSCSQSKDEEWKKTDPKPLFLDEEWTRRRSERIFLSEPSPQPSPALSPAPRGEPVWKLSNFMPKSKKLLDVSKSIKDSEKNKDLQDSMTDSNSSSTNVPVTTISLSETSDTAVKTEGRESISKMAPQKSVEISTVKLEDAKKIIKLEDAMPSLPLLPLAVKIKKSLKAELEKKKSMKKKEKTDETPAKTVTTLPNLDMKERRAEENSKIKLQKAKSLHDLTQRVKKKFSKASIKKQDDFEINKVSKPGQKKRKISTDSSDTDNIPLVSYRMISPSSEPRSCKLQQSDLREGLKVLYLIDGLFHEGTVKALQPPDVYGVLTAGQRGNRPHILCLEEILKWAVLDVKPSSVRCLSEGTRVCAFWSQQFSCLYPGTVAKSSPMSSGKKIMVSVEFDDGDNGRIEIDHIRLLPSDFPVVEYEPDPLESLPRRKQRSTSDASDRRKSVDNEPRSSRHSKEEVEKEKENNDDGSDDSDAGHSHRKASSGRETWRWEGKSTKRPGLKGKAKKIFYKAITRGRETIRVGDSAIFVSKERVNCPYIGHIESLWEGWNGQMMVKVRWYYHPEETESNKKLAEPKNALFESQHEDENDVQTIAHKCVVLSYSQYKKRVSSASKKGRSLKAAVFYVAGFYDPAAKDVTFHPGVS